MVDLLAVLAQKEAERRAQGFDYHRFIQLLTDNDLLMLFGETGVGKTKLALMLANAVALAGHRVRYYDTEHNLAVRQAANFEYEYLGSMEDMFKMSREIGKHDLDLFVIDSATLFITEMWFTADMNEKGAMLQRLQYVYGKLKRFCIEKRAVGIVVAQPTSVMIKSRYQPVGDKANYFIKECVEISATVSESTGLPISRSMGFFKSRTFGPGESLGRLTIDDQGTYVDEELWSRLMERL